MSLAARARGAPGARALLADKDYDGVTLIAECRALRSPGCRVAREYNCYESRCFNRQQLRGLGRVWNISVWGCRAIYYFMHEIVHFFPQMNGLLNVGVFAMTFATSAIQ